MPMAGNVTLWLPFLSVDPHTEMKSSILNEGLFIGWFFLACIQITHRHFPFHSPKWSFGEGFFPLDGSGFWSIILKCSNHLFIFFSKLYTTYHRHGNVLTKAKYILCNNWDLLHTPVLKSQEEVAVLWSKQQMASEPYFGLHSRNSEFFWRSWIYNLPPLYCSPFPDFLLHSR